MLNTLVDHNQDIKQLLDEGYTLEEMDNHLIIRDIPYLNSSGSIKNDGVLVTPLELTGNKTNSPIRDHVIHFKGDHPCDRNGNIISAIRHQSRTITRGGVTCNHSFSNKPPSGYRNYYEKVTRYIEIITSFARSLDPNVTPVLFRPVINSEKGDSVFHYRDTNSSISGINEINKRCRGLKVALIGLGGTGSYVLDHLARTEVSEIYLYDGDVFLQQNAFRSPGSISLEDFKDKPNKTDYYKDKYSQLRRGIISIPEYVTDANLSQFLKYDFVFINMDSEEIKRKIINLLVENHIKFIDTGIGLNISPTNKLSGIGRVIYSDQENKDHLEDRITYLNDDEKIYGSNIQTSDINSLLAALAVIKFKKTIGIYEDDLEESYNTFNYDIDNGGLISEKH